MIHVDAAARFLDFGARIGDVRGREQLEGAVALHHLLATQNVAYLADEVGMGKTYVALGAVALFRHFDPSFRVLVIAPQENIQSKWVKELENFVANNVRFADLRVKGLDGRPARATAECANLMDLVDAAVLDPHRDFFARLSSFSLAVRGADGVSDESAHSIRDRLRANLPWLDDSVFDLRNRQAFKDNVARAVCCALPVFDLVILDEAHKLKHGFHVNIAARNRVLGLALGRDRDDVDLRIFRGYGPRARRVLFLSATPIEDSYTQLWNQLNVVGHAKHHEPLRKPDVTDDDRKSHAKKFLVRRVTSLSVAGETLTKNLYRRTWSRGGVDAHDEPIRTDDVRQRLVVALVQKKVSEVLNDTRFNASFQIGMLASFESFLETARKRTDDEEGTFDQSEQTTNEAEREGVDVRGLNHLARSYRAVFNEEMPHPKMDAIVRSLSTAWMRGEKALLFVRRVASVKELKRKLDESYDRWLIGHLKESLPEKAAELDRVFLKYRELRTEALGRDRDQIPDSRRTNDDEADAGGIDTFFAWFFRGEGPHGWLSGARVQQRLQDAAFFEDNYAADLLGCRPGQVLERLSTVLRRESADLRPELQRRAIPFLPKSPKRADRFNAIQAAAVDLLASADAADVAERARLVWHARFAGARVRRAAGRVPDMVGLLEAPTFFTELRERPSLRAQLWPAVAEGKGPDAAFHERELRAQLLSSAARLGHSLIDLYVLYARRVPSLAAGAREERADDGDDVATTRIHEVLDLLDRQREIPRSERPWGAFDELSDLGVNHELIVETNAPKARRLDSGAGITKELTSLLRRQQPVGGMSGRVNGTLVRQFRMPGYPLVMVSTELLQEGEDLHTFCRSVHHYGISGMPSAMEQRIGRVDRVRSKTARSLSTLDRMPTGDEMLQVYVPHLEDTIEVLQVRHVLERMNQFLRLMHEGLEMPVDEKPKLDTKLEFLRARRPVEPITTRLRTAFPVDEAHLRGDVRELAVNSDVASPLLARFLALRGPLPGLEISWDVTTRTTMLIGTVKVGDRQQPFTLHLRSYGACPVVRCISPVGRVAPGDRIDEIVAALTREPARLAAILAKDERSYDVSIEEDVLLRIDSAAYDAERVAILIRRTTTPADRLERDLLGKDEPLETFRHDLERDGGDDET